MKFLGKTAVVTGASSGFGFEVALQLAREGAKVFACARREDRLNDLKSKHAGIVPVVMDVCGDLMPLQQIVANQPIDMLINNAGLAWGKESVEEAPRQKWETMIDTNVKALIAVTQFVLPGMIQRKTGDIVNVGSIAGYEFYAGGAAYCASKAAVVALTKAWRDDLCGQGIRVMGIHPGAAETEFSLVRFDGDKTKAQAVYQGMQPLTAVDIANAILWSLSCPRHMNVESMVILPTAQANVFHVHRD